MDCAACGAQVAAVLRGVPGVEAAQVNFAGATAELQAQDWPDLALVERRLARLGYALPRERVSIACDAAAFRVAHARIAERLPALAGFEEGAPGNVTLLLYPVGCRGAEVLAALREEGVAARIEAWESGSDEAQAHDQVDLLRKLVASVFLTLPLLWNPSPYLQFALATLILLVPARVFVRGATRALHGGPNMDVLIVLSCCLVYGYSTYLAFTVHEDIKLYYLCEGVLVSLILFGRYLESVARGETERSLRSFVSLLPRRARPVRAGGEAPTQVDVDELQVGDTVRVLAGERIPVDGRVVVGEGRADESLLTGESALVAKAAGDAVTAGTLLRCGGLDVQVTRLGKETSLEQMIEIVRQAQASSSPARKLADSIVAVFIPAVIAIACAVFCVWYFVVAPADLQQAILCCTGVLVVSCPCALGLAIPTSIMVGTGRCSELGILFKSAEAIEKMRTVKTVAFDKTGTLTRGGHDSDRNVLREGAAQAVRRLSEHFQVVMISGDSRPVAEQVGRLAGVGRVFGEVAPQEKAAVVARLQQEGPVMMVGDGVNDAPALAASDVSVSIQGGTDLARDTAQVILLGDDVSKLPLAFELSANIMRNIRENLSWALLYNAVCIPLAAAGLINPSLASAAMSFSSIAVLMNALRLRNMGGEGRA